MLYGIVDIGSNTIRLKIYEYKNNKIKSVFSKKKTAGLIAYRDDGKLNDEGINILSSILNKFNKIMNLLNVSRRYFFATASLRNISNTYEIIDFIKEKIGVDIHILDDETEAQLSFNSVKSTGLSSDDGILIDVGGGSSEIILKIKLLLIKEVCRWDLYHAMKIMLESCFQIKRNPKILKKE